MVAIKSLGTGSRIFISSGQNSFQILVPHSLPSPECGQDYNRCNILVFEHENHVYIIIPSTGGFMWLDYFPSEETPSTVYFQEVSQPCNPTKLFHTSGSNFFRVVLSCFNVTAQRDGRGSVYYIDFLYSVANNVTTFNQRVSSTRTSIYGLGSVSEAVYVNNLIPFGCFVNEEMYVFDDSFLLRTPTELFRTPDFVQESQLEDCSEYYHVEYSGLDRLILYCTNQRAVVYSMCTDDANYFDTSSTGIPYPCTADWSCVVYRRSDRLIVVSTDNTNGTEIEFNHEIVYGKCNGLMNDLLFWGLTQNGTLIRVSISRREQLVINNTCHGNSTCLRPIFSDQGSVYSYFDSTKSTIITVNSTSGLMLPEIQLPFHPDMFAIFTGPGVETCADQYSTTIAAATHTQTSTANTMGSTSEYAVGGTTVNFGTHSSSAANAESLHSLIALIVIICFAIH